MAETPMPMDEAIEHWKRNMSDRQRAELLLDVFKGASEGLHEMSFKCEGKFEDCHRGLCVSARKIIVLCTLKDTADAP